MRRETESKPNRNLRNFAVAGLAAVAVQLLEMPMAKKLALAVERRKWGLLKQLPLPTWLEATIGLLLLDYTLYVWHVLTHKLPLLWRFHAPHHIDLDLDASTALRFHFGEMTISVLWRAAQIVIFGISLRTLQIWQSAVLLSIVFHHSNINLPEDFERRLSYLIVTPRMHGIHHSTRYDEASSNWSSGIALWDRLHGTYRFDVPQQEISIGVSALRHPDDVRLGRVLRLPFTEVGNLWQTKV
ncbi:MAG: sterol desaturase family protein [Acidobacteriales bacterium]|nr:sterol desaturase family protein [Terriglobales bacterium]